MRKRIFGRVWVMRSLAALFGAGLVPHLPDRGLRTSAKPRKHPAVDGEPSHQRPWIACSSMYLGRS